MKLKAVLLEKNLLANNFQECKDKCIQLKEICQDEMKLNIFLKHQIINISADNRSVKNQIKWLKKSVLEILTIVE